MRSLPGWVPTKINPKPDGRIPWELRARVRRAVYRPLSVPVARPVLEPGYRAKLEAMLRPEADRLRELTGKAFADWSV